MGEPEALDEPRFESRDGSFVMTSWGGMSRHPASSVIEEQWRLALNRGGRNVTYQRRGSSWFVVSGTDRDGMEFYEKFTMNGRHAAALSVTFPRSRLREFESWVEEIEDGFRPVSLRNGQPELAAQLSPSAQQRDLEASPRNLEPSPRDESYIPERPTVRKAPKPSLTPTPRKPEVETPSAEKSLPSAAKVSGKPGFVYSPFSPNQKLVDVVGVPSGTKVKCPYTMKIFLVP